MFIELAHSAGSLVTAVYDDDSGSGREDDSTAEDPALLGNPNPQVHPSASSSEVSSNARANIGMVKPFWIPDDEAPHCQECGNKFTVIKRRHHCRACGRVLCSTCCHHKAPLPYMEYKEARVCAPCLLALLKSGKYNRLTYIEFLVFTPLH